ncbi:MAG: guanylate kinase [Novipirellula sp. JB048]
MSGQVDEQMSEQGCGRLVIISGPSGAGKSTVLRRLSSECDLPLQLSVSATTRPPRPGERDGVDYFFLDHAAFERRRQAGDFLECKEVFGRGHWYGTLKEQVATGLQAGKWVILEIDVQGALSILDHREFNPVTLFIHPGGIDELERRLRARATEAEPAIASRLETACREMQFLHRYQYEIINESVDRAVSDICEILKHEKETKACSKS